MGQLVDGAGLVAAVVGRAGRRHHHAAEPAVEGLGPAPLERPLDVAEQDDAVLVGVVVGLVHVGLVEHHAFAVAPAVGFAVDDDVAAVVVGRGQPQVVAQRAGERVAVGVELAARRQLGEHRRLDLGQRLQDGHRLGAQFLGRGVAGVIPLQVEALPAVLEEGIEADVVVAVGRLDAAQLGHLQGFVADRFPVVVQHLEFGDLAGGQVRGGRHARGQHHEGVDRRQQHRVIQQLPAQRQLDAATEVREQDGGKPDPGYQPFHT
ncbi:Uncharacterised protein [Achromobacter xylosoxidans]|nr:Uncharacterised protein [Achromobacter xylosoxidans]